MRSFTIVSLFLAGAALSACSTAPTDGPVIPTITDIGGQATHVGATYSVTQAGTLTAISGSPSILNGQLFWSDGATGTYAYAYESAAALALVGHVGSTQFTGLTGTLTTTPLTGTATYTGQYAFVTASTVSSAALAIVADFGALTIADTTAGVTVSGTISGNQFSGSFEIGASSFPLQGGFFGTNEIVGTWSGVGVTGLVYGVSP
jgi:hypothetical protein